MCYPPETSSPLPPDSIPAQVTESLGVPRVYIKLLVELEDFLNKSLADKVGRRTLLTCITAYGLFTNAWPHGLASVSSSRGCRGNMDGTSSEHP